MKRFCFVHVPKCGGMSFRDIVANRVGIEKVLPSVSNVEFMQLSASQIASYPVASGHFDHGVFDVLPPETLRFTILRDPVQRYLSTVSHMMRDANFSHLHECVRGLTFDEALLHPEVMSEMQNGMVKLFCQRTIPTGIGSLDEARATENLRSVIEAEIEVAIEHLDTYDVVGVQEHYFDSVQLMLLAAKLPPIKIAPLTNEDRTSRQSTASPSVINKVREILDLDQRLYDHAMGRLKGSISSTIYTLAMKNYAAKQPLLPRRFKFDLAQLPGGYGWYAPELDPDGARLWGGSRDEQGFVVNVEPRSKYVIVARLRKRDPDKELRVQSSIKDAETVWASSGLILRFETRPSDHLVDVSFIYPNATSPSESGTGSDQRKLGLVLYELAMFKVDNFYDRSPDDWLEIVHKARPGEIPYLA